MVIYFAYYIKHSITCSSHFSFFMLVLHFILIVQILMFFFYVCLNCSTAQSVLTFDIFALCHGLKITLYSWRKLAYTRNKDMQLEEGTTILQ